MENVHGQLHLCNLLFVFYIIASPCNTSGIILNCFKYLLFLLKMAKKLNEISCSCCTAWSWLPPPQLARRSWKQPFTWRFPTWAKNWHIGPHSISVWSCIDQQVFPHQVFKVNHQNKLVNFSKLVVWEANYIENTSNPFEGYLEVAHNENAISKLPSGKQGLLQGCIIFLTLSTL